ncbi:MAG: helix-turn-helix transcriptional regulator [Kiritimatiellae bacterium]|nr:helix-turn-helix transcriptional regulator [Kiritimatiellia bacterium]
MHLWTVHFQTVGPLPSFPRVQAICSEVQSSPKYYNAGRYRQKERQCLFKYSLQGEGAFRDGAGVHRVPKGAGFLCEIRDPETAYYYPEDGREPWTFVYITFWAESAQAMVRELLSRYGPLYELPPHEGLIRRLVEYRRCDGKRPAVTPAEGAELVMATLVSLAAARQSRLQERVGHALVRRAQDTVANRLDRNLNATELADLLSVSREHLARVFKEQTGTTPHAYILRQKMLLACHLLKESSLSSKEVAARLGYPQPAHFSRTFKRVLGMPPRRFREVGTIPAL